MGLTDGLTVTDRVTAQLEDCTPAEPKLVLPVAVPCEATPVAQAAQATIEQTGADPPPSNS